MSLLIMILVAALFLYVAYPLISRYIAVEEYHNCMKREGFANHGKNKKKKKKASVKSESSSTKDPINVMEDGLKQVKGLTPHAVKGLKNLMNTIQTMGSMDRNANRLPSSLALPTLDDSMMKSLTKDLEELDMFVNKMK